MPDDSRFRELIEQIPDYAIFLMDAGGRAISWNAGVQKVFGYGEAEFIGLEAPRLFTPEDRASGVPERELAYARAHDSASDDREMMRKDGSRFWASGRTSAMRGPGGEVAGYAKVVRDQSAEHDSITAAQRATELAERRAAELDAVIESIPDAIYIGTEDGITRCNATALRMLGASSLDDLRARIEELGRRFNVRWAGDGRPVLPEELAFARGLRGEVAVTDVIARRLDTGEDVYIRGTGAPIVHDGRIIGAVAVNTDVTQSRRAAEQLHQMQRMDAIGRLAGGIAHDLNNMLVAIIGHSDMIARDLAPGDERGEDVEQIKSAAQRSADLTRQLLTFARRDFVQPRRLDLNELVLRAMGIARPLAGDNIVFDVHLAPGISPIHADPGRVEQILVNLVVNARDAMPDGGRITVETSVVTLDGRYASRHPGIAIPGGRYIRLVVSDTGHGMDEATLARMWEPFFTTKPVGRGTGLGLSMVYGAMKTSGGFAWAYSEPGQGTAVKLYWPAADGDPDAPPVAAAADGPGGSETILVLDDEPVVRSAIARMLRPAGYTCLEAARAEDAIALASGGTPIDLVIADVVLPGMSGREAARRLSEREPGLPVLFISGYTGAEVIRRGLLEAGGAFLQKPFSAADLLRTVRQVLDARRRG